MFTVKSTSQAVLLTLVFFAVGCTPTTENLPSASGKPLSGKRRGEGIPQASLHNDFSLAHRVAGAPDAPENLDEDPSLELAEALWFAGDRDFARALSKEPPEVRRSVASDIALDDNFIKNFPRTYSLLSPYPFAH